MNTQFTFTPQGVQDWQDEVYAGGQSSVDNECLQIDTDFVTWLVYRFSLNESQEQFVVSLGSLTQLSYSTSLRDALQHRGTISLTKDEKPSTFATIKHPKIVYKEQQNAKQDQQSIAIDPEPTEQEVTLRFRITYSDPE
jgi:hypothetical protein